MGVPFDQTANFITSVNNVILKFDFSRSAALRKKGKSKQSKRSINNTMWLTSFLDNRCVLKMNGLELNGLEKLASSPDRCSSKRCSSIGINIFALGNHL